MKINENVFDNYLNDETKNKLMKNIREVNLEIPIILAPMAGFTDEPTRLIVKKFCNCLTVSEMVASNAIHFAIKNKKLIQNLNLFNREKEKGKHAIQIAGFDPKIMSEAAKFCEDLGADIIDINMGCPVKKIVNNESGAALMKNEKLAEEIIKYVVNAVKIPVTVKMRLGWDKENMNAINISKIAENYGVSSLTIHARTRSQFYTGEPMWEKIKPISEKIKTNIVGNGNVVDKESAIEMLEKSGSNGIMIGRAAIGAPWILKKIYDELFNFSEKKFKITNEIKLKTINEHFELMIEYYGNENGTILFRKHLSEYSKGMFGSSEFRNLINKINSSSEMKIIINDYFSNNFVE